MNVLVIIYMNIHLHQNNVLKNVLKTKNFILLKKHFVNLFVLVFMHILLIIKQMEVKYVMINVDFMNLITIDIVQKTVHKIYSFIVIVLPENNVLKIVLQHFKYIQLKINVFLDVLVNMLCHMIKKIMFVIKIVHIIL